MKSIHILIVLCLLLLLITNTTIVSSPLTAIQGRITDAETNQPVFFANVFLADTRIGTTSDSSGEYRIKNCPPGQYELVVHHVGYETIITNIRYDGKNPIIYNFRLNVKILQGEELTVTAAKPKKWKKNLKIFEKYFLGESVNARRTKILNPEVLHLNYDPETGFLTAKADDILLIENHALGYNINALLMYFQWYNMRGLRSDKNKTFENCYFTVKLNYEEMTPKNDKQHKKWLQNRERTYKGSFKHFLAAVAKKRLKKEKFVLSADDFILPADELKTVYDDSLNLYRLSFDKMIKIMYYGSRPKQTNWLQMKTEHVTIDTLGTLYDRSPFVFIKEGKWKEERVADWLPLDYTPNK